MISEPNNNNDVNINKLSDDNAKLTKEEKKAKLIETKILSYSKTFDLKFSDMRKIYMVGVTMFDNGISEFDFANIIEKLFDLSKQKSFEIAACMSIDTEKPKAPTEEEQIYSIADVLISEKNLKTLDEVEKLYQYDTGYYRSTAIEIYLKQDISYYGLECYGERYKTNIIGQVLARIKYQTATPKKCFNYNKNIIVVENGLLNIDTGELREHTPDEIYTSKFNFPYNPDAKLTPEFQHFLETTFKGVEYEIDVVQELFGYCLLSDYPIAMMFYLLGGGGNGKGTFLTILQGFIGEENSSAVSLHQLTNPQEKYKVATLYGKKLNVCGDVSKKLIKETNVIKMLTGLDPLTVEEKNKNPFTFINTAKIIIAGNEMTEFDDDSKGFIERIEIINFPNKFRFTDNDDSKMREKCMTKESYTGILTWAIQGYQRLMKQGKFSHQKTYKEKLELLNEKLNPIEYFIKECMKEQKDAFIPSEQLHKLYSLFAKKHNLPDYSQKEFITNFKSSLNEFGIYYNYKQKDRKYGFIGLVFSLS